MLELLEERFSPTIDSANRPTPAAIAYGTIFVSPTKLDPILSAPCQTSLTPVANGGSGVLDKVDCASDSLGHLVGNA